MGWTTCRDLQTLRSVIADRTQGSTNPAGTKWECLAKCYRGASFKGTLWTVWRYTTVDGKVTTYIGCDLIRYYGRNEGFGWKDMSADMHPFQYNCPLKYILTEGLTFQEGNTGLMEWIGGVLSKFKRKDSPIYKKCILKYPDAIKVFEAYEKDALENPFIPKKMVTLEEMFPNGIPVVKIEAAP